MSLDLFRGDDGVALTRLNEPGNDRVLKRLGVGKPELLDLTDFRISNLGDFFLNGTLGGTF